jgi:[acyl-carrier-protein] S-malonyltransferase
MPSARFRAAKRKGTVTVRHDEEPTAVQPELSGNLRKLAFVFPGQGSQVVGMGKQLAEAYPSAADIFSRADEILGFPLTKLCWEGPEEELRRTVNAQPALLTCSMAVLRVIEEAGLRADLLAGHSLGEFSAWVAAGALNFSDALQLVRKRGELMEQAAAAKPGGMLAVLGMEPPALKEILSRVKDGVAVMANINCTGQIVVSGEESALRQVRELAMQNGARAVPLRVSGAFHSPLMESGARAFKTELSKVRINPAHPAVICNTTARPARTPDAIRQAMAAQMTSPVLWEPTMQKMAQQGIGTFLELGPGEVLCGLIKRTLPNAQAFPIGEPEKLQEVVACLKRPAASSDSATTGNAAPEAS